jgi:hypothetical protein
MSESLDESFDTITGRAVRKLKHQGGSRDPRIDIFVFQTHPIGKTFLRVTIMKLWKRLANLQGYPRSEKR